MPAKIYFVKFDLKFHPQKTIISPPFSLLLSTTIFFKVFIASGILEASIWRFSIFTMDNLQYWAVWRFSHRLLVEQGHRFVCDLLFCPLLSYVLRFRDCEFLQVVCCIDIFVILLVTGATSTVASTMEDPKAKPRKAGHVAHNKDQSAQNYFDTK